MRAIDRAAIKEAFAVFDSDGSGQLKLDEFRAVLQASGTGTALSDRQVAALFQKLDAEKSGGINIDEFVNGWELMGLGAKTPQSRLVLYASDTPDKRDFILSLNTNVMDYEFDVVTDTKESLIKLVNDAKRKNGGPFASIGLAGHGGNSDAKNFKWAITNSLVVKGDTVGDDVIEVMRALGQATVAGGRVDLFACSLLKTKAGKTVFESIQKATDAHFAASDDLTGNSRGKGLQDWVMESDGVDIKPFYFGNTSEFDGNFGKGNVTMLPSSTSAKAKKMKGNVTMLP